MRFTRIFPITPAEAKQQGVQNTSRENRAALFPSRLRELREEKNSRLREQGRPEITQQDLGDYIDASRTTVGLYENGDSIPDIKRFARICDFYGVCYEYLLEENSAKSKEHRNAHGETGLSDGAISFLKSLPPEAKTAISQFLESPQFGEILNILLSIPKVNAMCKRQEDIEADQTKVKPYMRSLSLAGFASEDSNAIVLKPKEYKMLQTSQAEDLLRAYINSIPATVELPEWMPTITNRSAYAEEDMNGEEDRHSEMD